jgi:D-alanyl-D-alanine-carboxypeptidase/D-alanyl-D-alanine-endopeptidase
MTARCVGVLSALCLIVAGIGGASALAQQKPKVGGDYVGELGPLHLKLHIMAAADGSLSGTLDSPDQGAIGLACADLHLDGSALSFTVPTVKGSWKGSVSADGASLSGTWDQGRPSPLNFSRDTFVPATKPSRVDGIWLGTLEAGSRSLRIQITMKSDSAGKEYCELDSLDQRAMGLPCANVILNDQDFAFDVPVVKGLWRGKLSADGNTLTGTWTQGSPLELNFTRQTSAIAVKLPAPPSYDPALPPVTAADLQPVLAKDLAEALKSGQLALSTGAGVSIGVVDHGVRKVFTFGPAKADSIFEIGSITKTFTGLMLAQMIAQGKVKLDEPVRALLPPGTVAKPEGAEITLLDLVTQHSGLPRMPDNFHPADVQNPYADYSSAELYSYLGKRGVSKAADATFLYSNLGFGLLGQALAERAGVPYPELLKAEVTDPLGLHDTTIVLSPEQQSRFMPGHDADHNPAHAWDLVALAGAGAIRSTAGEMLTYLEANLHPDRVKPAVGADGKTLSAALVASHELRSGALPAERIAFAWLYKPETGEYWHNGATGGYSSYAFFNPKGDYAAVVLLNTSIGQDGSYADRLGEHISQRLAGKPAISLSDSK